MGIRLRPLRDDEVADFIRRGSEDYARQMVEHAGLTPEQAQKKSDNDWANLMPKGRIPSGHYVFAIEEEESGERVGDLWFAERTSDFDSTVAFVYAIEIREGFRGRGYGKQGMLLLEDEVRKLGLDHVALNVFGGNDVARSLYRSLGYAETAVWMRKAL